MALLGLLCLGAGPAAVAGKVTLDYRLDPDVVEVCPNEAEFRERAADCFNFDDPFVAADKNARAHLRIEIARDGKGYRGTLARVDDQGALISSTSHEVRDSCDLLAWVVSRRVALAVLKAPPPRPALTCDPCSDRQKIQRRLDAIDEKNEEQDAQLDLLKKQNAKLIKALEEAKKKMDLSYAFSAGALITANLTSNVGPGLWMGGEVRSGPLALGLELRGVLPAPVFLKPYDFDVSQMVGLLTPCGRYSVVFGCVVAGAGIEIHHDSNFGAIEGPTQTFPVVQLGGRLGIEVPFGDSMFAGRLWGEILYSTPPVSTTYYDADGEVEARWNRPDVSGFIGLGFVVKFGEGAR